MLVTCWCVMRLSLILRVYVTAALPPSIPAPTLLDCVFLENSNATCWWDKVDQAPVNTTYTLQVDEMLHLNGNLFRSRMCSTEGSNCSVTILTATANYCLSVVARGEGWEARSANRCLHGLEAVKLYPPVLHQLSPVKGHPHCLVLEWSIPAGFALSPQEIVEGHLQYQLQYQSERQIEEADLRCAKNVANSAHSQHSSPCRLCLFSPFTEYSVMIRYRFYRSPHWSDWSHGLQARTDEAAPSEAPQLWRWVEPIGLEQKRTVMLLWKPLPPFLANGNILGYNASCWCGDNPGERDSWDCGILLPSNTSCRLVLPLRRCSCTVNTCTAAGPSPARHIALPAPDNPGKSPDSRFKLDTPAGHTVGPPPVVLSVLSLDDITLRVQWKAPKNWTVMGYVVEWVEITGTKLCRPSWQEVDGNIEGTIITEGIHPEVRYLVSVRALYWAGPEVEPGEEVAVEIYSRQGAPSAGPKFWVKEVGSGSVLLCWEAVSVEQQRGFIRNYTLHCLGSDGQDMRVVLPADARQHSLSGLQGVYIFYLVSSTDAGNSSSQPITVNVDHDHVSLVTILSCVILPTLTVLMLVAFLWHRNRVVQLLWPTIPDPNHSSLSAWTPRLHCRVMKDTDKVQFPELDSPDEQDHSYPLLVIPVMPCGPSNPLPDSADCGSEATCYLNMRSALFGNPLQKDGPPESRRSPSQAHAGLGDSQDQT